MKIAIIGAGIGGLTTALLLERQGHAVTIYEQHEQPGGRMQYETDGVFQIDQGPTIVLLPDMIRNVLRACEIPAEALDIVQCDPLYDIHFADGTSYTKYSDPARQREELSHKFPSELPHYDQFISDMEEVYRIGVKQFLEQDFSNKRRFFTPANLHFLYKSKAYRDVHAYIGKYFTDPKLQHAYALQSLYIGGSPYATPAIYGLISYSEHIHGIWYVKGGYAGFVNTLVSYCKERGIEIHCNSKVDRIHKSAKQVTGINVNGSFEAYDSVVFNGDFPAIHDLLDQKKPARKQPEASSGCLLIYIRANRKWDNLNTHQFVLPEQFEKNMRAVFESQTVPEDPSFYVFHPGSIDAAAAPAGESALYFLVPVPSGNKIDWEQQKDLLAERVLDKAERLLLPGLKESIEWLKVRTPADAQHAGLYQGGSFGIAPSLFQSGGFRPQNKPFPIKGLYAVGASVHPGGGVPIVMQGAKNLSELIMSEVDYYAQKTIRESM
ncbi:NAD(P)/FAD-dependent oxidoreductase [Terribacillus sp. DMT04]|uniref:phytoene desaturase family protein n=1 Tax=Terribacillus sp. DMT04 TaxID=2850441 RepID=UPI001C2B9236|nr:phytoene desaturase family protein [Terribacillus sp. DMT04]QXE00238.1 phytoene desaturase [Terribacillus sp. DMT04]